MKKKLLVIGLSLFLVGCSNKTKETETSKETEKTEITSSSSSSKEKEQETTNSTTIEAKTDEGKKVEISAESLMADYPVWTIESGITPADYNVERKAEANRRLLENGLPEDNEYINRNPIVINRETEKKVHEMVGNLDYIPVEANTVINGVIVEE